MAISTIHGDRQGGINESSAGMRKWVVLFFKARARKGF